MIGKKAMEKLQRRFSPVASAKPHKGINGKGGKTSNFIIPDWMFERELSETNSISRKEEF